MCVGYNPLMKEFPFYVFGLVFAFAFVITQKLAKSKKVKYPFWFRWFLALIALVLFYLGFKEAFSNFNCWAI